MTAKELQFMHLEIVHNDPASAMKFMQEVLGAEQCEEGIASGIATYCRNECLHVIVGGMVFQFLSPGVLPDSWKNTLEAHGPRVHNLGLRCANPTELKDEMLARGNEDLGDMAGPQFDKSILKMMFPTLPEAELSFEGYFVGMIEDAGVRVELSGTALGDDLPILTGQLKEGSNTKCMYIDIVHPDPRAAAQYMEEVFGAKPCEQELAAGISKVFQTECCIELAGGVVYRITQPGTLPASWKDALEKEGPCVHDVCFMIDDVQAMKEKMLSRGCKLIADMDFTPEQLAAMYPQTEGKDVQLEGCWIDATEQVGMRFALVSNEMAPYWPYLTGQF